MGGAMDEPAQYIDFMVKYKDWVSIRRQAFDESAKPEEAAYILSTIRSSIENRYYKILGIDVKMLDDYISKIPLAGKGYESMGRALLQLEQKEAKDVAQNACSDKRMKKIAESYMVLRLAERANVKPYMDSDELLKIFPELKIYKPKMPKGMKKDKKSKADLEDE